MGNVRPTGKAPLINSCSLTVCLNPLANHQLNFWNIRNGYAKLCWNWLTAIASQEKMLSNFSPSLERCCWSWHASSTSAQIAFQAFGANLGWLVTPVKSVWNMYCQWESVLAGHSTFSVNDIWIKSSSQRRAMNVSHTTIHTCISFIPLWQSLETQRLFWFPSIFFKLNILDIDIVVRWWCGSL